MGFFSIQIHWEVMSNVSFLGFLVEKSKQRVVNSLFQNGMPAQTKQHSTFFTPFQFSSWSSKTALFRNVYVRRVWGQVDVCGCGVAVHKPKHRYP